MVPPAFGREKPPEVTADGLHRVEGSKLALVYKKPGASLSGYDKLMILDCFVAFKKHWRTEDTQRAMQVSPQDMDKIKKDLAAEFRKVFIDELQTKGGYQVVDTPAEDVLLVRPAIIDLDIEVPDRMTPGMSMTFSASAGQMTLYAELYDSVTSDILARVIDPEAGQDDGMIQWQNSVTNKAEADRILKKWADILRQRLDESRGKP